MLASAAIVRDFEPALCEAALPEAIARFGAVIPVQLRGYLHGLPAAAGGTLLARLASGPRTLLHGDARLENIFVPPELLAPEIDDDQVAAATGHVRFVDYGDVAAGRGAYDVACLLSSALAPEDRCVAFALIICALIIFPMALELRLTLAAPPAAVATSARRRSTGCWVNTTTH